MAHDDYRTNGGKWQPFTAREKCPVCGKPEGAISPDGKMISCFGSASQDIPKGVYRNDGLNWTFYKNHKEDSPLAFSGYRKAKAKGVSPEVEPVPPLESKEKLGLQEKAKKAYENARTDDHILQWWANNTEVPLIGLKRTQVRAVLARSHNGRGYLITPERFSFDEQTNSLTDGGYCRRYSDNKKFQFTASPRGIDSWGNSQIVHLVEGWRDMATLAAAGLTAISKPGCNQGVAAVACMLDELNATTVYVWGEWDGGRGKAEVYAKKLSEIIQRPIEIVVVYPPKQDKDVHRMFASWCKRRKVEPSKTYKSQLKKFARRIAGHAKRKGKAIYRSDRQAAACMQGHLKRATELYDLSRMEVAQCKCGKALIYGKVFDGKIRKDGKVQGVGTPKDGAFTPRCGKSITCDRCRRIHEILTECKYHWAMSKQYEEEIYFYECPEEDAKNLTDKLAYQAKKDDRKHGTANVRLRDEETGIRTRAVLTTIRRDDLQPTTLTSHQAGFKLKWLLILATCEKPAGCEKFNRFWLTGIWSAKDKDLHDRFGDSERGEFEAIGRTTPEVYFATAKQMKLRIDTQDMAGDHPTILEWHSAGLKGNDKIDPFFEAIAENHNAIVDEVNRSKRRDDWITRAIGNRGFIAMGDGKFRLIPLSVVKSKTYNGEDRKRGQQGQGELPLDWLGDQWSTAG